MYRFLGTLRLLGSWVGSLALILAVGASTPASAQKLVAPGFPPIVDGTPVYTVEAVNDTCVAVLLVDLQGRLWQVNSAFVAADATSVITPFRTLGGFIVKPIFVTFAPTTGATPLQECASGPVSANILSDPTLVPTIWLTSSNANALGEGPLVEFNQSASVTGAPQTITVTITQGNGNGDIATISGIGGGDTSLSNNGSAVINVGFPVTSVNFRAYSAGAPLLASLGSCLSHASIFTGNSLQWNCQ